MTEAPAGCILVYACGSLVRAERGARSHLAACAVRRVWRNGVERVCPSGQAERARRQRSSPWAETARGLGSPQANRARAEGGAQSQMPSGARPESSRSSDGRATIDVCRVVNRLVVNTFVVNKLVEIYTAQHIVAWSRHEIVHRPLGERRGFLRSGEGTRRARVSGFANGTTSWWRASRRMGKTSPIAGTRQTTGIGRLGVPVRGCRGRDRPGRCHRGHGAGGPPRSFHGLAHGFDDEAVDRGERGPRSAPSSSE